MYINFCVWVSVCVGMWTSMCLCVCNCLWLSVYLVFLYVCMCEYVYEIVSVKVIYVFCKHKYLCVTHLLYKCV